MLGTERHTYIPSHSPASNPFRLYSVGMSRQQLVYQRTYKELFLHFIFVVIDRFTDKALTFMALYLSHRSLLQAPLT